MLKIDIDHTGKVIDSKITRSIGSGCDEEAQRIVKLLKFEIPKTPRKLRVLFHKNLKIQFKLPKTKTPSKTPKSPKSKLNYSFSTPPKEDRTIEKEETPKSNSYYYTIKW